MSRFRGPAAVLGRPLANTIRVRIAQPAQIDLCGSWVPGNDGQVRLAGSGASSGHPGTELADEPGGRR